MITVLGSINLDQIGFVERFPSPGETVPGLTFTVKAGGKGANQALAARRAGAAVRMVGAVGRDAFAEPALAPLRAEGVDLAGVLHLEGATGLALILVDRSGENQIAVFANANGRLDAQAADVALAGMERGDILALQQEVPQNVNRLAIRQARERGIVTVLNTAPFLETTPEVADEADILIANAHEFLSLAGCTLPDLEAAMIHRSARTGRTVVVTRGPDGATAVSRGDVARAAAPPIRAVSTVGAGDVFCGSFAAALSLGRTVGAALAEAVGAASAHCGRAQG